MKIKRARYGWSLVAATVLIAVPVAGAAQGDSRTIDPQAIERLRAATGGRAEVSIRRGTGAAQFVRLAPGAEGAVSLAPQSARGESAREQARAFLAEHGSIFGIQNAATDLEVRGERTDQLGFTHVAFQQLHHGVAVFGAVLKGHLDSKGRLVAVNGTGIPGISVDTTTRRTPAEASATAVGLVAAGLDAASAKGLSATNARLVVYRTGLLQGVEGLDHLTYEVEVTNGGSIREFVFVDAHTGKKVDQITGIHDGLNRRAYNGLSLPTVPPNYPDAPSWEEGQLPYPTGTTEADNMLFASKEAYDLFMNAFGYGSFNGAGATMDAIFNRGYGCPNASWNGTFISFCPGFTTDDVTAHEWGHAYTQHTDNLIYAWQSGALNEAYSDIFGETVDLINGRGLDTPNALRVSDGSCSQYGGTPPPLLTVTGGSAAGSYQSRASVNEPARPFTVGPTPMAISVPPGACSTVTGVSGKIAIIDWTLLPDGGNECGSGARATNAFNAGAVGIIFVAPTSGLLNLGSITSIASVEVTYANGTTIKAGLPAAATITLHAGTAASRRWLMGEEVTPGGALRDMWNPRCFGNPGKVTDTFEYVCSTADQGGVHSNSGIPNRMFSLLVDGGPYNNQNVQAIGLTKAVHIYFRTKFYQVASTDFPEHASAMEQACEDLRGNNLNDLTTGAPSGQFITATDCAQVTKAIAAVELRTPPAFCPFVPQLGQSPPANVCVLGPANLLYSESVEGSITQWTRTNAGVFPSYTPRDWVKTSTLPGGRTGSAFFGLDDPNLGDCGVADESGVMYLDSPTITLPATPGFPRLFFDHYVATEGGWDGGNVKISVNGGSWQNTAFTQFTYNPYIYQLFPAGSPDFNTNPLAGEQAFTGTDGGSNRGRWGKSIVNLAGVAVPEDTVRFRFAFGTDGCGGNDGWYVDDIKVYQCTAGGAATLSIFDLIVSEGGSGVATFMIGLSEQSANTVTVRVNTADGTATAGSDYTAVVDQLVTFPVGDIVRAVNVRILGDGITEPNETFSVNLSAATNATIADSQGLGTIRNDDFFLSVNDVTVTEGNSGSANATFTITLSVASSNTVTVTVDTADGTATAGTDYTAVVGQLVTFAPGVITQTVDVPVLGDMAVEPTETFSVNLSGATGATIADNQGLGTIGSDEIDLIFRDGFSGAALSVSDVTVTEGNTGSANATFTIALSEPRASIVAVTVDTADGTATAGADYTALVGQLVRFDPSVTIQTVNVPVLGDGAGEPDETFLVNLSAATGATIADPQGIGTVVNDDFSLSINDATVTEGNSGSANATFTVSLSAASPNTVTVTASTANGTATAGTDYTAVVGQVLTFPPGVLTQTVDVPVLGNGTTEPNETFFVNLIAATNATISDAQGLGTITNDDFALSVSDRSIAEGDAGSSNATFTITLSAASPNTVTVTVDTADGTATAGADYTAVVGQVVTFAPGVLTQTVDVPVLGDTAIEPNETFSVNLSAPTGATITDSQGVGTIATDDVALSINDVTITEGDAGFANAVFTITLSSPRAVPVTVTVDTVDGTATAGTASPADYRAVVSQVVTFAAGVTTRNLNVRAFGDVTTEPGETFSVNLSAPANATIADAQGIGTILDNDLILSIDDATVIEGNTGSATATFTVTLSAASASTVTVTANTANGTATAGTDYTAVVGQLVTFAPGVTTQTVDVTVAGDLTFEVDETYTVNLSAATNATIGHAQGQGTILNDEAGPTLSINDVTVTEGDAGAADAAFTVSLSWPSSLPVTVRADTANGTATAGSDYTAVVSRLVTFAPGVTTQTVNVPVSGDLTVEPTETFLVNLSAPTNGTLADTQGVGTIVNDDSALSIDDASVTEGNSGLLRRDLHHHPVLGESSHRGDRHREYRQRYGG
ncbi:MAG TPA: Calx-beta domain-containing protein [Vicinamibacteria bacterium]|nr:Calx-beta domain-containing protein [Vicinamibacteria bacterium]